jgi:hypothetical protein
MTNVACLLAPLAATPGTLAALGVTGDAVTAVSVAAMLSTLLIIGGDTALTALDCQAIFADTLHMRGDLSLGSNTQKSTPRPIGLKPSYRARPLPARARGKIISGLPDWTCRC